ncbi:protocatechuate 3,4-dioxygenase subunit beta [Blastococcus sp. SYSU D00695]
MTPSTSDGGPVLPRYPRQDPAQRVPLAYRDYRSTALRAPLRTPVDLPQRLTEVTGPVLGEDRVRPEDADLTWRNGGEALGQRVLVHGRVLDSDGRPVPGALVEVWQANAAGRYRHVADTWPAPLDPHFDGLGRVVTDSLGRYEFLTVRPGAYPWGNHPNAWRPAHIHFSLSGRAFVQRLVTQMYFPDDPLFGQDPVFCAIPAAARHRAVSRFSLERTRPDWALAYEWDVVLRGAEQTPFEAHSDGPDDGDVA